MRCSMGGEESRETDYSGLAVLGRAPRHGAADLTHALDDVQAALRDVNIPNAECRELAPTESGVGEGGEQISPRTGGVDQHPYLFVSEVSAAPLDDARQCRFRAVGHRRPSDKERPGATSSVSPAV
jgi:hypothetical protein